MSEGILVIGAGGHAKVVISTARACGLEVLGALDDDPSRWGAKLLGVPILGGTAELAKHPEAHAVIAIGSNAVRRKILLRYPSTRWRSLVHPHAVVDESVTLGDGSVIFAGVVVQPDARIGRHCILNTGCTVDHDCSLGNFVHVAPGSNLAGAVALDEGVFCGIGSAVTPTRRVGAWSVVGAGGVVVYDLPRDVTAVGVPARVIKRRSEGWHL